MLLLYLKCFKYVIGGDYSVHLWISENFIEYGASLICSL